MVSFNNFHRLDPAARDVAIELLANADKSQPSSFMSFTYRWMAFNGWMSAITLENTDREMIEALESLQRLSDAHTGLMTSEPYRSGVDAFAALWPVFNVRDARKKLGYDVFAQYNRAALLATNVKRQASRRW